MFSGHRLRRPRCERSRTTAGLRAPRLRPAQSYGLQYPHAAAHPAAEAISEGGRPRRRSVKNRKSFDCFKSAAGIRFSAGAAVDPEIVSPRRFLVLPFVRTKGNIRKKILRFFRTAQFAAVPLRQTACQNRKCSPQDCAGRSLPTAEARYSLIAHSRGPPQATTRTVAPQPENGKNDKKCTYFVGCCNYLYYFWTKRSVETT